MRGMIIAGTHSGCGKTTAALGIMAALRKKGLTVQPFKAGPDFIDAGLHRVAAGRRSRNLDQWMCGKDYVIDCFQKHAAASDITVIEGVMGMYDGEFSTASLARLLRVPVVLVIDSYGMAESAGAMVYGFAEFGVQSSEFRASTEKPKFAGVVFNRVASEGHYQRLKESVRDIPVLGYLPRELNFEIPHRHLGLATAEEGPLSDENMDRLTEAVLHHIDVDMIINNAGLQKEMSLHRDTLLSQRVLESAGTRGARDARKAVQFRLAVAYDKAFCFYYEDNLDMLRDAGAEIVRFSPLSDRSIPGSADAVYIGGGYPELNADALSRNTSMLESVRRWSESGRPVYAECGGLMYLSRGIQDFDGKFCAMAGVFPFETRMLKKPKLAYRAIELWEDCILGKKGESCRGHEFHYSEIVRSSNDTGFAESYSVRDKYGKEALPEGFRIRNTLASYIHVHFGSNRNIAKRFAGFVK